MPLGAYRHQQPLIDEEDSLLNAEAEVTLAITPS